MPEKQKKSESLAHTPIAESSKAREDTAAVPLIFHTPPAVVLPSMQTFGQGLDFFASHITMMTEGMKYQARHLEQETATKILQLEKALQEVAQLKEQSYKVIELKHGIQNIPLSSIEKEKKAQFKAALKLMAGRRLERCPLNWTDETPSA
ncbi:hypothetical protein GOP47_0012816 [Adiantum capillus-veneris]|uniref:Uncharacterized protein n=1 Tax=Adiantum capillus-veneris TaxID=13818 RepID=A0A9D4URS8_ADICA|nr:hypothetical protein GOP47_0012816 [Adiantum capillus-veneris]